MQDYKVDLHLNTKPAQATIAALDAKIAKLQKTALGALSTGVKNTGLKNTTTAAEKLDAEFKQLKLDMLALSKISIAGNTSRQLNQIDAQAAKLNATLLKLRMAGVLNNKVYDSMADNLQKTSTELMKVKKNADFGYSSLRKFWERFGKVALGFSIMYTGMRLVGSAFMQLTSIMKEGIQQAGEMVSIQAKLAMWYALSTNSVDDYAGSFKKARVNVEALADVSVTSLSSLSELGTALDEIGQSSVGLGVDSLKQFANLVDFTVLIAKTTDSSLKQVRQELQALMQGQVKASNILIRTALHMGMISEDQVKALRNQEGRLKAIKSIMTSIAVVWPKVMKEMVSADVNTGLKMWYDTLVRIVSKSEALASKKEGQTSIFGTTAYEHLTRMQTALNDLTADSTGLMNVLNAGFGGVLTGIEKTISGVSTLGDELWKLRDVADVTLKPLMAYISMRGLGSWIKAPQLGIISAIALGLDSITKSALDLEKSPLESIWDKFVVDMKKAYKTTTDIAKATAWLAKGYVNALGQMTRSGVLNVGSIDDVNNAIEYTKKQIKDLEEQAKTGTAFERWKLKDNIEETNEYLQKLETRSAALAKPLNEAAKGLAEFVKNAKKVNDVLKGMNFDPISSLTQAVTEGSLKKVTLLQEQAQKIADTQITQTKAKITEVSALPESDKRTVAITALNLLLMEQQEAQKKVTSAICDTNIVLKEQLAPIDDLKEKHAELEATIDGTLDKYKQQKLIKDTIASVDKAYIGDITPVMKKEIASLVKANALLEKQLNVKKEIAKEWSSYYEDQITSRMNIDKKATTMTAALQKDFYAELYAMQTTDAQKAKDVITEKLATYKNSLTEMGISLADYQTVSDKLWKDYYDGLAKEEKTWQDALKDGLKEAGENIGYTYENIKSTVTGAFSSMTDALTSFVMTGKLEFSDFANSIIEDMIKMQIQSSITSQLSSGLTSIASTAGNSMLNAYYGNVDGVGATGPIQVNALGGVYQTPSLHEYANTVQTQPKLFEFASGGVFAEAGPEAVMPLTKDANGELGVNASGQETQQVTVNIINESGHQLQESSQSTSFDAQGMIVTLWMDAFQRNKNGLRESLGA